MDGFCRAQGRLGMRQSGNPPRLYTLMRYQNQLEHVCRVAEARQLPHAYPPPLRLGTHVRAQLSSTVETAVMVGPWLATTVSSDCIGRLGAALCTREKRPNASGSAVKPWLRCITAPKMPTPLRLTLQAELAVPLARRGGGAAPPKRLPQLGRHSPGLLSLSLA